MKDQKQKRLLTVSFSCTREYNGKHINIPYFRLSAKWLFEAGFRSGDFLHVEITENALTISKANHNCQKNAVKEENKIYTEMPYPTE